MQKWFPWLYLAMGVSQAAHSIEEVLTELWRWMPLVSGKLHALAAWLPVVHMSERTFVIANMLIITGRLAFSPLVFLNRTWAWTIATLLAVIETLNRIGHLTETCLMQGYFPGCIAAVGLIAFSVPLWSRGVFPKKGAR